MAEIKLDNARESVKALFKKGIEAQERQNLEYAMDLFEAVLQQEPALLQARRHLREAAFMHIESGNRRPLSGIKLATTLLKLNSLLKKNPEQVLNETEKLLRADPFNVKISLLQADAARACNRPEISRMTLGLLNRHAPGNLTLLERLADLSREAELYDEEYECRDQIAKIKPGDSTALKQLKDAAARLTMGKSGWQDATTYRELTPEQKPVQGSNIEQRIQKVTESPDNLTNCMELADAYLRNRQFDDALKTLQAFQDRTSTNHIDLDLKIQKICEQKMTMELAEAEDRQNDERIANIRQQLKELQITSAAQLTQRYPTDLQLKYDYGKRLFEARQFTEAIQQFQQAKENPQRRPQSLLYLARAFKEKGQIQIATEHFQGALKELPQMNNSRKEVLYELGRLYDQAGEKEKAHTYLKEIYSADIGFRDVAKRVENVND